MGNKVYILGNGNQAPYGIDEIIDIIPMAHSRKIIALCAEFYNAPTLRLNSKSGNIVDIDNGELVDIGRTEY